MVIQLLRTCTFFVLLQLVFVLTAQGATTVTWNSLKKLDDLAERSEVLCERKAVAELRKLAPAIKKAAAVVIADPVPRDAKNSGQVKILQGDLKSLHNGLSNPAQQDGGELSAIICGIHPIVEALMEAAGMPHVHEDEKPSKGSKP